MKKMCHGVLPRRSYVVCKVLVDIFPEEFRTEAADANQPAPAVVQPDGMRCL